MTTRRFATKISLALSTMTASALSLVAACEGPPERKPASTGASQSETGAARAADVTANGVERGAVAKATDFFEKVPTTDDPWLAYQNTHLCLLSYVGGNFSSDDPRGTALVDWPMYEYWTAFWDPGRSSVRAICTNWNNFRIPSGGGMWVSAGASAEVSGNSDGTKEANAWPGDSVTFVRGVEGEMQSNTEYVQILQSTTIAGKSKLRVHSEEGDALDWTILTGYSHSVQVGVAQSQLARLIGINSSGAYVRGTVNSTGVFEYPVSTVSGYSSYWLATVSSAVCSFTRIAGNFDGGAERLHIYQNGDRWFLQAAGGSGKAVYGRVRCMAYDQR